MAFTGYPTLRNITPSSTFTDEDSPTINYTVPAVSEVRKLEACIADADTGTTIYVPYREVDKNATSYTFNFTSSELDTIYSVLDKSRTMLVRFYLKSTMTTGEVNLHSLTGGIGIVDAEPVLNPTVKDINSITLAMTNDNQIVVLGYSNLDFMVNAVARKGATIVSQTATCGTQKKTTRAGAFVGATSGIITFTATDSRGITSTRTINLQTVNYVKVSCHQDVRLNEDGTVSITLSGDYYNGSFGEYDNTLKLEIRHTQDDGTMGSWVNLTPLGYEVSGNTYTLDYTASGFDQSGTYEFQSRATDGITSATTDEQSITWFPVFDWGKNDFNFNVPVYAPELSVDDIEINGRAYGTNRLLWEGVSHMNGGQSITFSQTINRQPNGIILVFSSYEGGAEMDTGINTFFISKYQVNAMGASAGHTFQMVADPTFSSIGAKTLYISSTGIKGDASNTASGTYNGVQYVNGNFVLRYVIGV